MKKVWVEDDCISCGSCVEDLPEVFGMDDDIAYVVKDADLSLDDQITETAEICPVEAIKYEE